MQTPHGSTAQKMKFPFKDFFSKYDQIRSLLWIWSHLLKKFLMENFIFCAAKSTYKTNLTKLLRQPKHACRIIFYEHKFIHTQPLLKKLNAINIFQINAH